MLYLISFFAGILTILAPCVLPLIPVICGRGIDAGSWRRIAIIILSFVVSIVGFTLLLKVSAASIGFDTQILKIISASILILFGCVMIFPHVRDRIVIKTRISQSGIFMSKSQQFGWIIGDILLGASLWPIFSSCSPTYALIIAIVLPVSFVSGLVAMIMYALGIASMLLLIIWWGRELIQKLKFVADSDGWIKKLLGLLILLTGIAIITGFDKVVENTFVDILGTDLVERESNIIKELR